MEALDGHFLRGAAHPLDLTVGPGVARLNEPFLDAVRLANVVEVHLMLRDGGTVARPRSKLDAPPFYFARDKIVPQNRANLVQGGPP